MIPDDGSFPSRPALVAGLGRAGQAAVAALAGRDCKLVAWDAVPAGRRGLARGLKRRGVDVVLGGNGIDALDRAGAGALVVKSPGIGFDAPVMCAAASRGHEVIDELELGARLGRGRIVGVTGTNGKSTTAGLVVAILERTGTPVELAGNTEFGPPLSAVRGEGWAVCEVSSFQLEAAPTFAPEVGVFTNLTLEHLPRHGSMEAYGEAKRSMFLRGGRPLKAAAVCIDDPFGRRLAADLRAARGRVASFGLSTQADVRVAVEERSLRESLVELRFEGTTTRIRSRLPGEHNALNMAAAFAVGRLLGIDSVTIEQALSCADAPPGRCELIDCGQPFDVMVDYAHTSDGIERSLAAARAVAARRGSKLRTVFGAVGLSDPPKARESGRVARALSDHLVLTTGTAPGSHRVLRLRELWRAGSVGGEVELVLERRAAIARALAAAEPGDVVAILGLGALQRLIIDPAGTQVPFDDRRVARELLGVKE